MEAVSPSRGHATSPNHQLAHSTAYPVYSLQYFGASCVLAFVVGGLGFEFCVFVAGWRHALRSEWPFMIIISISVHSIKIEVLP